MLTWIRRILIGVVGVILVLVVGFAGWIIVDSATSAGVAGFTNTQFDGPDDVTLNAYIAQPAGEGPFPAVMLIHEWWGLRPDITELADELAAEGYVVMAVDAYRGRTTNAIPRALWLVLNTPQEQISADMRASYEYLAGLENVDAARIATFGFCFGGTQSLAFGIDNADEVAAVITFYGGGPVTDPATLQPLADTPVLGVFGREDGSIPVEQVTAFEAALNEVAAPAQVSIYDGVGHAFVNPEAIAEDGSAAQQAWDEALTFLAAYLAPAEPEAAA